MHAQTVDLDNDAMHHLLGGKWVRVFANCSANGKATFVFQNKTDRSDLVVMRTEEKDSAYNTQRIDVPGIGRMHFHRAVDDPALGGLQAILDEYAPYEIVRYRPGKRLTAIGEDKVHGPVVIKCVARGVGEIWEKHGILWAYRHQFRFFVSKPLKKYAIANTFVQTKLDGVPLQIERLSDARNVGAALANAIASMHHSDARFSSSFTVEDQQRRTARYVDKITERFPEYREIISALEVRLENLTSTLLARARIPSPIHGSLHSHQWLKSANGLALVDFDRVVMGDPELDAATFLAEWDYEPETLGKPIKQSFLEAFGSFDEMHLQFYRAHKHISKAFKAAKGSAEQVARYKCGRNLRRAEQLLTTDNVMV